MSNKTVYVEDKTSAQLRSHMKMLLRIPGWHEPLADRLWREIQEQDAELKRLHAENEKLRKAQEK